jgi:hypothetical protein
MNKLKNFFQRKATKKEVNYFIFYMLGMISGFIIGLSCAISIIINK